MRELETQSQSAKKKFTIIDILKVQDKEDLKQVNWIRFSWRVVRNLYCFDSVNPHENFHNIQTFQG